MGINKKEREKQWCNRMNEINISNEGYKMRIVKYNGVRDIIIEFQDEHKTKVHTTYRYFKKGNVKNPFHPSVFGVGYLGEGKYKVSYNGKHTKCYNTWNNMLQRCYEPYTVNKRPTYINCYVCEDWLNFQNFAKWYEESYYEIEGEKMHLDKDILVKGNKIYSPETCIFVPNRINVLFTKTNSNRGELPIGVHYNKRNKCLCSECSILDKEKENKKIKFLGYFPLSEPFHAFYTYKVFKENYIKQVADEYKEIIPQKLYESLYRYEIEIND